MAKFYITTPIYYVNDVPHIGHTCTTVVADIVARYHKLLGEEVFFLTGTDEHGAKVAQAARQTNLAPKVFCDKVAKNFENIWPKLHIQYDYFIRTTDHEHEKVVANFIQKIYQKGDIYKGKYEGLYCLGCEKFITESDLVDGKCPLHPNQKIQQQSEENYFFKLSKYAPTLIRAIEEPDDKYHYEIKPASKKEEVLSKLKAGVNDLSISRANVEWGIPVPWDKSQTIYVWFDALINYYSALKINNKENFWPADIHLIGKEILWFHAVIWEAMLVSTGISLPETIYAHDFYMIDGQKMSKSIGNVISPQELLDKFGADATRYLIASSFPYSSDSDVGWKKFTEKYNADLANGLGNLIARVAKLCETANLPNSYYHDMFHDSREYGEMINEFRFDQALAIIWNKIDKANKFIDKEKPWGKQGKNLEKVLDYLRKEILEIAYLLTPFIPETSEKITQQFSGPTIKPQPPLFPRIKC